MRLYVKKIDDLFNDIMLKKLEEQKKHLTVDTIAEMRWA